MNNSKTYCGDALVLNEEEFTSFCKNYSEVNGVPSETIFDDELVREYEFCESENPSATFNVLDILGEHHDEVHLVPFVIDGEPNVQIRNADGKITRNKVVFNFQGKDCYIITAKRDRYSMDSFGESPYNSYDELKHEFQNLLMDYLPGDFDWDRHIGLFSYIPRV